MSHFRSPFMRRFKQKIGKKGEENPHKVVPFYKPETKYKWMPRAIYKPLVRYLVEIFSKYFVESKYLNLRILWPIYKLSKKSI